MMNMCASYCKIDKLGKILPFAILCFVNANMQTLSQSESTKSQNKFETLELPGELKNLNLEALLKTTLRFWLMGLGSWL